MTDEKMPEKIWAKRDNDGYIDVSEKIWDDYDPACETPYVQTSFHSAELEKVLETLLDYRRGVPAWESQSTLRKEVSEAIAILNNIINGAQ